MEILIILLFAATGGALSLFLQSLRNKQPNHCSFIDIPRNNCGLLSGNRKGCNTDLGGFCECKFKHSHGKLCNFCNKKPACWSIVALLPTEGETVFCCDDCKDIAKWSTQHRVDLPFIPDADVRLLLIEAESLTGEEPIEPDHENKNPQ